MLELLVLMGRAMTWACGGHQELVLENMTLQQQLRAVKRNTKRPCFGGPTDCFESS